MFYSEAWRWARCWGLVGLGSPCRPVGVSSTRGTHHPTAESPRESHRLGLPSPSSTRASCPGACPPASLSPGWLGMNGAQDPGTFFWYLSFPICPRPARTVVSGFAREPHCPAPLSPSHLHLCLGVASSTLSPALGLCLPARPVQRVPCPPRPRRLGCPVTGSLGPCGQQGCGPVALTVSRTVGTERVAELPGASVSHWSCGAPGGSGGTPCLGSVGSCSRAGAVLPGQRSGP